MRLRRIFQGFMLLLVLAVAAIMLLPWKPLVEQQLVRMLAKQGIAPAQVTVDHIGWRGLVLKDVSLGEPPLKLAQITLGYQPRALLRGQVEAVEMGGLSIHAVERDGAWKVEGLEGLPHSDKPQKTSSIPVTLDDLKKLPLREIRLQESEVTVDGADIFAAIPLSLRLQKNIENAAARITATSDAAQIKMGKNSLAIGHSSIEATLDAAAQQWQGTWAMDDMVLTSESLSLPPLQASGTLKLLRDSVEVAGSIRSRDKFYAAEFTLAYALNNPAASALVITRTSMPFNGGTLATRNVRVPLGGKKQALRFTLSLRNIAVDTLMQALTDNRATASGMVSGDVPVTITAAGKLLVGKGSLKAQEPGTIALAPEVIPGDNPQVALVREVMKNLQYKLLALDFSMGADNKLAARLAVEGQNPDVEQGRPVKLTINLSGDLLDLITQNVTLMTAPKTFIEQKRHEKNP